MTQQTFEEQFPSLTGEGVRSMIRLGSSLLEPLYEERYVYYQDKIQKFCLDKQKVRESFETLSIRIRNKNHLEIHHPLDDFAKELGI